MKFNKFAWCLGLLFATSACFAQMYTITDLGTLVGNCGATGINSSGQVVGVCNYVGSSNGQQLGSAFRTAPNSPINPATDDLGTLGGRWTEALAINESGQVVGRSESDMNSGTVHAFNSTINPATDDLGTLGGTYSWALAINTSGQVVGTSRTIDNILHAFLCGNHVMHDLNNLIPAGSNWVITDAAAINDTGHYIASSLRIPSRFQCC